jgi:catechol 2,3-dioxygenase-like lactoylglutathione lyase family enzyme
MFRQRSIRSAVVLGGLASSLMWAQTKPTTPVEPSPNLAGIAHIAVRVHNLDASVAFYKKLGFVEAFALSRNGAVYEAFFKINDRQYMELYPVDAKNPQTGFLHVCFEGADLQAAHDFYVSEGLTPNAVRKAGAGNLLFTMPGPATPSGPQNLEYTQYMPGSMHSKDFGQHLGADRIGTRLLEVAIAAEDPQAAEGFYAHELRFTPVTADGTTFALPAVAGSAAATERIRIEPVQPLGFRSWVVMEADPKHAARELKRRGITFSKTRVEGRPALELHDPDGNALLLAVAPSAGHND